ncbi:hypothetical protein F4553_007881 [Allocatelliglobosispora scoriae]|uniref:Uncharacterized protein n=1 Tax=Allocatelliglobosispora scoriae TaxID=643052 RepID=A0A841BZ71_9ACTN|nr:hypothetical protein [Allocatelliglobosispora scoriae]MBB5874447.1 hypothetical protein [Allocatelliglobosispora scoriae]
MPIADVLCQSVVSMSNQRLECRVLIKVQTHDDFAGLMDLYRWLRDDQEVAASAKVLRNSHTPPGHMGAVETIDLVITHVTAIASLLISYASWLKSRSRPPQCTFSIGGLDVTPRDASPATTEQLITVLTALAAAERKSDEAG